MNDVQVGGGVTVTVTVCVVVPPVPVQAMVNAILAVRLGIICVPPVPLVPDHPPLAVQEVAFALDQVMVVEPPVVTPDGDAEMVTVGVGGGVVLPLAYS